MMPASAANITFGLDNAQQQALTAFLATDGTSLTRETPAEFSLRQMKLPQVSRQMRRLAPLRYLSRKWRARGCRQQR